MLNKSVNIDEMNKFFVQLWIEPDERMRQLVEDVRKVHKVGLLSNNVNEISPILHEKYDLKNRFDTVVLSNEIKVRKPDLEIYEHCLRELEIQDPFRTVFIDDLQENCEAAEEAGMQAIKFESYEDLLENLQKRSILKA